MRGQALLSRFLLVVVVLVELACLALLAALIL